MNSWWNSLGHPGEVGITEFYADLSGLFLSPPYIRQTRQFLRSLSLCGTESLLLASAEPEVLSYTGAVQTMTQTHTRAHTHHRWWIAFHLLLSNFSFVFQQFESAISWCGFFIFVLHGVCWASWKYKLKFSIKFGEFSHIISSDIFFFFLFSFGFSHHENVGLLDVFWGSVHFTLVVFLSVLQIK